MKAASRFAPWWVTLVNPGMSLAVAMLGTCAATAATMVAAAHRQPLEPLPRVRR